MCRKPRTGAWVAGSAAFVVLAATAAADPVGLEVKASGKKTIYFDDRAGNNQVAIYSRSTLEDFTTVCNRVAGECTFDPRDVTTLRGKFALRVDELRTGIELRDEHMRGPDWLDAKAHPTITVEITGVAEPRRTAPNEATLLLVAAVTVRDRTQALKIPANVTYLDESPVTQRRVKGDLLRIRAEFKLQLSEFGVSGPRGSDFIGLKVADTLDIQVTVFGSTDKPPPAITADERPAGDVTVKPPPPKKPG